MESFALLQSGGHVRIGRGTTNGIGANVIEERMVGSGAVVAAGTAVVDDVEPDVLVAGAPARVKKVLRAAPAA